LPAAGGVESKGQKLASNTGECPPKGVAAQKRPSPLTVSYKYLTESRKSDKK
jgi:hypothetical protein